MKSLRLLPLLLIVLALGLPTSTHAQSDAPYIYYYSDLLKGWVIERADGTDGRVIGLDILEDFDYFFDVNWSPSGKWLAWRASPFSEGVGWYRGGAIRADDSKTMSILADVKGRVWNLTWSPTEDLLVTTYNIDLDPRSGVVIAIIDPEQDVIIAQTTIEYKLGGYFGGTIAWLGDGSGVYFDGYTISQDFSVITILYKNGGTKSRVYSHIDSSSLSIFDGRATFITNLDYQYMLAIEDLTTDRIVTASELFNRSFGLGYKVYWNPPMTHALILNWDCSGDVPCFYDSREANFSLLEWASGDRTILGSNYWVSRPEADDIRLLNRNDDELNNHLWSPDGSHAVFLDRYRNKDGQQSGQLMLVNVQDATITRLPHINDIYAWQWIDNDALLVKRDSDESPYRYDLNTFEVRSLAPYRPEYAWYQLSPSGRYMGSNSNTILDLENIETIHWIPNGNPCAYEVDYLWNQDEIWFLTGQPAVCAGGYGGGYGGISIHSMDNTIHRELTVCSEVGTCAGFLPERAIPHLSASQAESVFLQPDAILTQSGQYEGIVNWSPDSRFLVTASYTYTQTETEPSTKTTLKFWDMAASPTLIGAGESSADCNPCTVQWSANSQQMIWSGNSITEVWDATTGRLLRQERIFPPPPLPEPHSHSYAPLVCEEALNLRPNPVEPNSTLAWVNDRWLRFSNGTKNCSRDGKWLMVFSNDNRLTALNPQTMRTFDLGEVSLKWNNTFFEYQPTSPLLLATAGNSPYNSRMQLFDIELGQWLTVPINFFTSNAALSPDGRWIAAAGAQTVTIWDIAKIRARQVVE